jgi:Legionella pneumophila major outer membrane protein precursor
MLDRNEVRSGGISRLRTLLCASVSTFALATASAQAADLPSKMTYKAPPPVSTGTVTLWAEGAAFWTAKDPVSFTAPAAYGGVLASFPSSNPIGTGPGLNAQVGWEAAIGIDYGFANTPWHVSFDMRYGQSRASTSLSASSGPSASTATSLANESLGLREDHTVADLMFGREIPVLGPGGQLQFGIRLADLGADIKQNASLSTCSPSSCSPAISSALLSSDERSSFLGVGPRVALEGSVPLANSGWAIEYLGGAAALIGTRQLNTSGNVNCTSSASACVSTGPGSAFGVTLTNGLFSTQISDLTPVFNADASIALSYAFSPGSVFSVGFRFDGYWDALKTVTSAGQLTNVDRLYYGPFARYTARF